MRKRQLDTTGLEVSFISVGGALLACMHQVAGWHLTTGGSCKAVRALVELTE